MNQTRMRPHQSAPTVIAIFAMLSASGGCGSNNTGSASDSKPLSADHPRPRPQNKPACDACGGLWGVHGIAEVETCVCRTADGGSQCRDGAQCDGVCQVDDYSQFEASDTDATLGSFVGRCSDYDTVFGCYRVLPLGSSTREPLPADEAADDICVD
jgi:hypothetical protein